MNLSSFYPVLMTHSVAEVAAFYVDRFSFEVTFSADWYVSLRLGDFELAVLDADHPTVPAGWGAVAGGILLNFEVDDADTVLADLVTAGVPLVQPIRDEAFGQRHFIVEGPDRVLIDVIQPIPPSQEFVDAYLAEAD
ncbi:VOC family protein [Naumannella halotolerans]|uniref:Putative glyoxalase superfamily protein PhnB n=1 Tax=Naumannella halotolerans TaxID=993414 RepID=A0A4R7J961_9ACTN|nr:VOC family protein [Naumannella halotolerans]TDT33865.1 putative glyoxalase superfamily protein PhnB [Naumannella halotolerans]